jgi:hypothetical protein
VANQCQSINQSINQSIKKQHKTVMQPAGAKTLSGILQGFAFVYQAK